MTRTDRFFQVLLIASGCYLSWLLFMAIHELGHVMGALATGARVERVVLGPLLISETVLGENPRPLLVVWAGPVLGVLLPAALWGGVRLLKCSRAYLLRFLAGFCLVANGAYIGADAFYQNGDGRVMALCGTPVWAMLLFGMVTVTPGLLLWHRQGRFFGMGEAGGRVARADAVAVSIAMVVVVAAELVLFRA
jgi:hypothetical protein